MLLDNSATTINNSTSILSFETEGSAAWPIWDRYISIDGKKAFEIGNICETCEFYFKRLEGANRSIEPEALTSALNAGLSGLDDGLISDVSTLLPSGGYRVLLSEVTPKLVTPGDPDDYFVDEQVQSWGLDGFYNLPHFPQTEYYRTNKTLFGEAACFFEFLIPMFPHNWLKEETIQTYSKIFEDGGRPTAVSLTVLDIKTSAEREDLTTHWCLAHYLIDGHHKAYAAAQSQTPMTLLSFLAIDHGICDVKGIDYLVQNLLSET